MNSWLKDWFFNRYCKTATVGWGLAFILDLYYYLTPAHWPKKYPTKHYMPIYQQFMLDGILAISWPFLLPVHFIMSWEKMTIFQRAIGLIAWVLIMFA